MKSPYDLIRALISALVACLNSDGAAAQAKAQIEIDLLSEAVRVSNNANCLATGSFLH